MKAGSLLLRDTRKSASARLLFLITMMLTVFFIGTLSVSGAFMRFSAEKAEMLYGTFDNIYYRMEDNDFLEEYEAYIGNSGYIHVCYFDGEIVLGSADQEALTLGNIHILEGEMPEVSGEIAVTAEFSYSKTPALTPGDTIMVDGAEYQITGIVNTYASLWNKPKNEETLLPDVLLNAEDGADKQALFCHVLIQNKKAFPDEVYDMYPQLLSNTNKVTGSDSAAYEMPFGIVLLMALCGLLLHVYIYDYYLTLETPGIVIFRKTGMRFSEMLRYCYRKLMLIYAAALLAGLVLGNIVGVIVTAVFGKLLLRRGF